MTRELNTGGFLSVKNFERFQHYKDRNPVWIKLYNELLDDYEFGRLPDASKAHLLAIWLLASRYNNRIPDDATWIARRINATDPVDLALLVEGGFLIADQDCSNLLAEPEQVAIPEKRREEGEKREIPPSEGAGAPSLEALLYQRGKELMGKNSGGQVTKLRNAVGDDVAVLAILNEAKGKSNPAEWVAGVIRQRSSQEDREWQEILKEAERMRNLR